MNEIILSADQASILSSAQGLVAICRPDGSFIGWFSPMTNYVIPDKHSFTPEEVAAAESSVHAPGIWSTTEEVLEQLRTLEPPQP